MRRGVLFLFLALSFLHLVPLWSVRWLPTVDGPCHLYNSWVFRELVTGRANDAVRATYDVDWRPHPNWTGTAFMAAAQSVVPPIVAEKLFVTLILLTLLGSAWFLGKRYAFLVFPFAYHLFFLTYGFYNFSLSVGLYLLTVAAWWKTRNPWLVAALLITSYFTHPLATAFAIGSIGMLWLCAKDRRLVELVALIPAAALLVWFVRSEGTKAAADSRPFLEKLHGLAAMTSVFERAYAGYAVSFSILLLIVITIMRERLFRRREDAWFVLFVMLLAIYFLVPARLVGGGEVNDRLAILIPLVLLPWLSIGTRGERILIACATIFAVAQPVITWRQMRDKSALIEQLVGAAEVIPPHRVVLPLLFSDIRPLAHAIDYAAVRRGLVDLNNFQPETGYVPIRYRKSAEMSRLDIEADPAHLDLDRYLDKAEFVFTWDLPARSRIDRAIAYRYNRLTDRGRASIFQRRGDGRVRTVILPFAGSAGEFRSANGSRWRIDQTVRNTGSKPARLFVTTCLGEAPCEIELAPGQSERIESANPLAPYTIARVPPDLVDALQFTTVLRRTDAMDFHAEVPAVVPQRGPIVFRGVPLSRKARLNLRLWGYPLTHGHSYRVAVVAGGRELAARDFATGGDGFVTDNDLMGQFPDLVRLDTAGEIHVHVDEGWALILATDRATKRPTLMFPDAPK